MNGGPLRRTVTVTNPMGFHFRPIAAFAQLAGRFQGNVTVWKGDRRVNGKSPLELMTLAAEQGTELTVEVSGPDAAGAVDALAEVLASPGQEDEPEPPLPLKG
ncbi:MAG: HPr family phosphocarrier protein [Planctomycetia bacterium]|nr:HPr family phosphocarrier protein [Planctomycetia bacterium]